MSTGGKRSNQSPPDDAGGGNIVGKGPTKHTLHQPPNFLGKSGQGDNQSTKRPKGNN
jgi:hypothetical protein